MRPWHVDYLLGADPVDVDVAVRTPGTDAKCQIAAAVAGEPVVGMGCTDCDYRSHVAYAPRRNDLVESVRRAHETYPAGSA